MLRIYIQKYFSKKIDRTHDKMMVSKSQVDLLTLRLNAWSSVA